MQDSAGTLLYRQRQGMLQVLLVHPSGNYNRHAAWGIPKGLLEAGEALEAAARRETREETGLVASALTSLGSVDYTRSPKRVHCFAGPGPEDSEPTCASWEVDQAEYLPIEVARIKIGTDQRAFLDRLVEHLARTSSG